jgi:hypothetical protein
MPNNSQPNDYRALLDEKFESVNSHFSDVNKTLERIENQTTKTNGRVNELEKKVNDLQIEELTHVLKCPQTDKIVKIQTALDDYKLEQDKNLTEYNFFKKYPKAALMLILGSLIILFLSFYEVSRAFATDVKTTTEQFDKINDQQNKEISDIQSQNKQIMDILKELKNNIKK